MNRVLRRLEASHESGNVEAELGVSLVLENVITIALRRPRLVTRGESLVIVTVVPHQDLDLIVFPCDYVIAPAGDPLGTQSRQEPVAVIRRFAESLPVNQPEPAVKDGVAGPVFLEDIGEVPKPKGLHESHGSQVVLVM